MCLQRAIVLGKTLADKHNFKIKKGKKSTEYKTANNDLKTYYYNTNRLTNDAFKLSSDCRIDTDIDCGIEEIKKIERHLREYQICVLSAA